MALCNLCTKSHVHVCHRKLSTWQGKLFNIAAKLMKLDRNSHFGVAGVGSVVEHLLNTYKILGQIVSTEKNTQTHFDLIVIHQMHGKMDIVLKEKLH